MVKLKDLKIKRIFNTDGKNWIAIPTEAFNLLCPEWSGMFCGIVFCDEKHPETTYMPSKVDDVYNSESLYNIFFKRLSALKSVQISSIHIENIYDAKAYQEISKIPRPLQRMPGLYTRSVMKEIWSNTSEHVYEKKDFFPFCQNDTDQNLSMSCFFSPNIIAFEIDETPDGQCIVGALETRNGKDCDKHVREENICAKFTNWTDAKRARDILTVTMWRIGGMELSPHNIEHEVFKLMTMLKPSILEAFDCDPPQEETLEMNAGC